MLPGTSRQTALLVPQTSMLSHAQGRDEEALGELTQASDLEASMDKHPVTPGGIVPVRELLGDLLLELNRPAQALKAYEQTLATDPGRLRSVYGAAKAAAWYSKARAAKRVEVHVCNVSDVSRPRGAPAGLVELARWTSVRVAPEAPAKGDGEG